MQRDEVVPGACYSCQYVSLVCAEGIEGQTSQVEGIQDIGPPEAGSAVGVAYTADGIARPALRDDTVDPDVATVGGTVGDGKCC